MRPSLGYGGADRVTVNLLNHYDRDAYEIELAVMNAKGEFQSSLDSEVVLHNMNVGWMGFAVKPLVKIIKKGNYDVLYSTCGGMSIPMMMAAQRSGFKGIKIVSERNSLHRTYSSVIKKKSLLSLKKKFYPRADIVTVVSEGIGQQVHDILDVKKQNIRVVHNPLIGPEFYAQVEEDVPAVFPKDTCNLLAVGRFVKQKDYPTLIKAFNTAYTQNKKLRLYILGKGPLQEDVVELIHLLALDNAVFLLGFDINPFKYMGKVNAFVLSSLHEGMPGVLIQAMAAGLAVISTDCPTGPSEVINQNENGILVPVSDFHALADAMIRVATDHPFAQKIGKNAAESIHKYTIEEGVKSYFSFLGKE